MKITNDKYKGINGADEIYSHPIYKKIKYSNNIRDIFKDQNCYWLFDCIISYQFEKKFKEQDFQVWELERVFENNKRTNVFNLTCTVEIYNEEEEEEQYLIIAKQNIPYSDFKDDKLKIWLMGNVLILPEEY